jgi:hypothetical protein
VRKTDLKIILPDPSSWPDLTTTKRKRNRRKLFHGGDVISVLMPPSGNKSLHVVISKKMLMPKLSPSRNINIKAKKVGIKLQKEDGNSKR